MSECGDPIATMPLLNEEFVSGSSPSSFQYGIIFQVKCMPSNNWVDGTSIKSINCTESAKWSFVEECLGKEKIINK